MKVVNYIAVYKSIHDIGKATHYDKQKPRHRVKICIYSKDNEDHKGNKPNIGNRQSKCGTSIGKKVEGYSQGSCQGITFQCKPLKKPIKKK